MKKLMAFVFTLIVFTFMIAGCSGGTTKTSVLTTINSPMPSVTPSSTVSISSAVTTTANSNIQWPSSMPANLPIFTYGTIMGSNNNNEIVQVTFNNVSADAQIKYEGDLKNAGWSIYKSVYNISAKGNEIDATIGRPAGLSVLFTNNGTKVTITYYPNQLP